MLIKLKEIANIVMGQSPKSTYYNSDGYGTPFMQGCTTFGYLYPKIDTWTTNYNKIANKNSILFTVRAPVGDVNIANQNIAIGRGLASINPQNNIHYKYLYYLLLANKSKFKNNSSGTVYESINKEQLENAEVSIHNHADQLHIVDIIVCLLFLLFLMLILYSFQVNLLVLLIQLLFVLLFLLETCYCYHLLQHIFLILMNNH